MEDVDAARPSSVTTMPRLPAAPALDSTRKSSLIVDSDQDGSDVMKTMVAIAALLATSAASAQMNATDLKWSPVPAVFPKGAQIAVLSGDPAKSGMFAIRLRMPAGYAVAAHHHPSDEILTVISGDFSLGMGDRLNRAKVATLRAGGFARAPAGMNHYGFTRTGTVVQIIAEGPFVITYANPADDPTTKH
jgi:quercetin dioxygenase-like cupin family protein